MKRLSLILAVSVFAGVAGSAVAQTDPDGRPGKTLDAEHRAIDRTEEDHTQAASENPRQAPNMEWLNSPPGVGRSTENFSVVTNPDQSHCATALGSAMNACLIAVGRCMQGVKNYPSFLRCAEASIQCIEAAEAAFDACLEEND